MMCMYQRICFRRKFSFFSCPYEQDLADWILIGTLGRSKGTKIKGRLEPPHAPKSDMVWTAWHEMGPAVAKNQGHTTTHSSARIDVHTPRRKRSGKHSPEEANLPSKE